MKSFTKSIIAISITFVLALGTIASASYTFFKLSFKLCYIEGRSMYPTLNGSGEPGRYNFGYYIDKRYQIDAIKRFNIVITYYPDDYSSDGNLKPRAEKKIKRVIGFPGETVKFLDGQLYVKKVGSSIFEKMEIPDNPNPYHNKTYLLGDSRYIGTSIHIPNGEHLLGDNEYYVKGDNWFLYKDNQGTIRTESSDSVEKGPIKKDFIVGVLFLIHGYCSKKIENGEDVLYNYQYFPPIFYL